MGVTYKSSGVNLQAAVKSTKSIASLARSTFNERVLKDIGLFAGFFELDLQKYKHPVIVSSIDGVGTKLKIAFMMNKHDTVGQDLVNHCVNDIMTSGADPLFFLDYIGVQKLDPDVAVKVLVGMAEACRNNRCALIGGETAEMPGFYSAGEYDLVGTIIGAVDRDKIIDGSKIAPGDILLGLPSNGLHTNGYSLARKVLIEIAKVDLHQHVEKLKGCWGDTLLKTHKSYKNEIEQIRGLEGLVGISHITGGGLEGNTSRLLRPGLSLSFDWDRWQIPPEFQLLSDLGDISAEEMRKVFNMGIGLVFIVHCEHVHNIIASLQEIGEEPFEIGRVMGT